MKQSLIAIALTMSVTIGVSAQAPDRTRAGDAQTESMGFIPDPARRPREAVREVDQLGEDVDVDLRRGQHGNGHGPRDGLRLVPEGQRVRAVEVQEDHGLAAE